MTRKPLIGITVAHCDEELKTFPRAYYVECIRKAGGQPILLSPIKATEEANELLDILDGLLLSGGGDISPIIIGEIPDRGIGGCHPERDLSEILLTKAALKRDIPVLGICRGIQVLAISAGGKIYQDIVSQYPGVIEHRQKAPREHVWHKVDLLDSDLKTILGVNRLDINSIHHQAVSVLPDGFRVSAVAEDGLIEAIEKVDANWGMGVQWHPESLSEDPLSQRIFEEFVKASISDKHKMD